MRGAARAKAFEAPGAQKTRPTNSATSRGRWAVAGGARGPGARGPQLYERNRTGSAELLDATPPQDCEGATGLRRRSFHQRLNTDYEPSAGAGCAIWFNNSTARCTAFGSAAIRSAHLW